MPAPRDGLACLLQVRRLPRLETSGNLNIFVLWLGVAHRGRPDTRGLTSGYAS